MLYGGKNMDKVSLQVNLGYSSDKLSAYGLIEDKPRIIIVRDFPELFKQVRGLGIKLEDLTRSK